MAERALNCPASGQFDKAGLYPPAFDRLGMRSTPSEARSAYDGLSGDETHLLGVKGYSPKSSVEARGSVRPTVKLPHSHGRHHRRGPGNSAGRGVAPQAFAVFLLQITAKTAAGVATGRRLVARGSAALGRDEVMAQLQPSTSSAYESTVPLLKRLSYGDRRRPSSVRLAEAGTVAAAVRRPFSTRPHHRRGARGAGFGAASWGKLLSSPATHRH